jgi:Skp family chaperone for outer membrane proteins
MSPWLIALAVQAGALAPAAAQTPQPTPAPALRTEIVVVDIQRVLRDAAVAAELRRIEREEGQALRERLDALSEAFEAEEAELTSLRDQRDAGTFDRDAFDRRVQDFDRRVRAARQEAQENSVAFQARFAQAFETLERRAGPVIAELMAARGATVVLDLRNVFVAANEVNMTAEVIARLDEVLPASAAPRLLPPNPAPR